MNNRRLAPLSLSSLKSSGRFSLSTSNSFVYVWFFSLTEDESFDYASNPFILKSTYFLFFYFNSKIYFSFFENFHKLFSYFFDFLLESKLPRTITIFAPSLSKSGYVLMSYLHNLSIKYSVVSNSSELLSISFSLNSFSFSFRCSSKIYYLFSSSLFKVESFSFFPQFLNKFSLSNLGSFIPSYLVPLSTSSFFYSENFLLYLNLFYAYFSTLSAFLLFFIKFFGLSCVLGNLSISSLAKYIFLYYYDFNFINLNPSPQETIYLADSYYGGRSEIFGNPNDNEIICYYDYSGMYGQCMQDFFHYGKAFLSTPTEVKSPGFYSIDWFCPENIVPVLPLRCPVTHEIFYLTGRHSGVYWFEEILLALSQGYFIKKIFHAYLYPGFGKVFVHFIDFFFTLRSKGSCWKILGKLVINNFYGSLSLKKKLSNVRVFTSLPAFNSFISDANSFHYVFFDNKYFVFYYSSGKDDYARNTNVGYASAIASKARIKLFSSFDRISCEGGRLLMCDVDAIYASYPSSYEPSSSVFFKWLNVYKDAFFSSPNYFVLQKFDLSCEGRIPQSSFAKIDFYSLKFDFYSKSSDYFSFKYYRKRVFSFDKKFSSAHSIFPK